MYAIHTGPKESLLDVKRVVYDKHASVVKVFVEIEDGL